jgi:hypothetical protein
MKRRIRKLVSLILSIAIFVTNAPLPVFAGGDTVGYIFTAAGGGGTALAGDAGQPQPQS